MTAPPKIRHGHEITQQGHIHYNEIPITWDHADELAGFRLDRRRRWCFIDGKPFYSVSWSQHCSGCTQYPEMSDPPEKGLGCSECGYQGRVKASAFIPYSRKVSEEATS